MAEKSDTTQIANEGEPPSNTQAAPCPPYTISTGAIGGVQSEPQSEKAPCLLPAVLAVLSRERGEFLCRASGPSLLDPPDSLASVSG